MQHYILILSLLCFAGSARAGLTNSVSASEPVPRPAAQFPLRSLGPPVSLPDGSEFLTWEASPKFTRTYYVDAHHPAANDDNPGTPERPWKTINQAAQVLQPGERVVVAEGVYRELIQPARGGTSPTQMISYEAAPGARVVVKGSRPFTPSWKALPSSTNVWQALLVPGLFAGYNPFAIDNVTPKQFEAMDWATPLRGKTPYTLPRGLVFQDGRLLTQVDAAAKLSAQPGTYWVDRTNQALHVHPFNSHIPNQSEWEITTQETVFAPAKPGLSFIRVKGFTIEHAAGPWPWEQIGAISANRGHHWIIEDNTVRWVNGVGIDLGSTHPRWPQPDLIGFHIVRRNTVTDCGICGIAGLGPGNGREFGLLIEDNVLLRNAWYDVERLFELAAIKTHNNVRCLIRRNLIVDTRYGSGIWMDWNNQFSRCSQNLILGTRTLHGGIFVEASYEPNLVDQNVIWDTTGHGIYEHDSCNQVFAHNLIGRSSKSGLHLHGKITDRRISGRPIVGGRHLVANNVFFGNTVTNEYRGEPSKITGSLELSGTSSFDLAKFEMTFSHNGPIPQCDPVSGITWDFFNVLRTSEKPLPGPFQYLPQTRQAIKVWPISSQSPNANLTGIVPTPVWKRLPQRKPDGELVDTGSHITTNRSGWQRSFEYSESAAIGRKHAKVVVLIYDPVLSSQSGKSLIEHFRWNDPVQYSHILADVIQQASWGYVNYEIVDWITIRGFPRRRDGTRYTEPEYLEAKRTQKWHPVTASYRGFFDENGLLERCRREGITELWVWGAPGMHIDEFAGYIPNRYARFGPTDNPWFYRPYDIPPEIGHTMWVMGFNYEVGADNMIHSYVHRVESMAALAFGDGLWNTRELRDPWNVFSFLQMDHTNSPSMVGNCHVPPNGQSGYDYNNKRRVLSWADHWMQYPDLRGSPRLVGAAEWGNSQFGYMKWWLERMPKYPGHTQYGYNNWWVYVANTDEDLPEYQPSKPDRFILPDSFPQH